MVCSDLTARFFKAAVSGDKNQILHVGKVIITEERKKKHHVLADRLNSILFDKVYKFCSQDRLVDNKVSSFLYEISPEKKLSDLILGEKTLLLLNEVVKEHQSKDLLVSRGLFPRNKLMFVGLPGNGKTSLAEVLACSLELPLFVVRYDGVIGSFLGETASRLRRVFEFVGKQDCVLFFDEFEVFGKDRGDVHESGEIKRLVSSLLLQIDSLSNDVVLVVASNHAHLFDSAVWRRFQIKINLPSPRKVDVERYLKSYEFKTGLNFGVDLKNIVEKLKILSYGELEEFCRSVFRCSVMANVESNARDVTYEKLLEWDSFSKIRIEADDDREKVVRENWRVVV